VSEALHALYGVLPHRAKSIAASVRGFQLQQWRYGPETDDLVEEAVERESWSGVQWRCFQEGKLAALLERAARSVPFYRRQWSERRRSGDRSPVDRLESWPILSKEQVRESPAAFVSDGVDRRRLHQEQTSGTTGKPLRLWHSRQTSRDWFALFETRVRRWNGISRSDRWAMLGGQLVVPVGRRKPPFWVWNAGMKQLYMSSYHLSPGVIEAYLEAMRGYAVTYMLGYASSMTTIAWEVLEAGIPALPLCVAISNAEPLSDLQRARISSAFNCPVRDTYGMAEMACGASECATGSLHIWPEAGVLEILRDDSDESVPAGESGRLVATGLLNVDMPLVRYDLGDRGALADSDVACPCGRLLPRFQTIEGRSDDVLLTPEGRRVGRMDPVFKGDLPIREAQIVQEALNQVRVQVVPASGFGPSHVLQLRRLLQGRLGGSVEITIDFVDEIPRGPGGKFRAVVSRIAANPRRAV
jgi:phenylacetate-CoA ligase